MNLACSILPDQSFLVARQAHHIYETAKMKGIGLDPLDGPSVILSEEAHTVMTNKLRDATGMVKPDKLQKLWNAYKDVYVDHPAWIKSIAHYFGE